MIKIKESEMISISEMPDLNMVVNPVHDRAFRSIILTIKTQKFNGKTIFTAKEGTLINQGIQYVVQVFPTKETELFMAHLGVSIRRNVF